MDYETDLSKQRFPGIAKAALEMSYANGGINRDRREREVVTKLDTLLSSEIDLTMDLGSISLWLGALPEDNLLAVVDGEEGEQQAILASAPAGTDHLLTRIFDEVA
jgi:hypothetical protein